MLTLPLLAGETSAAKRAHTQDTQKVGIKRGTPKQPIHTPPPGEDDASQAKIPFAEEFEVSRSFDGRYRVMATRLKKYEEGDAAVAGLEVGLNHGYFRIRVDDHVTGLSVDFPKHLFLYYGALHRESIREAFVWHPTRHVLMYMSQSARHWETHEVWEFQSGKASAVRAVVGNPRRDADAAPETEISFSALGLAFAEKAAQPVYIGMSPPDPVPQGWAVIETMHSYGNFKRWDGDDAVFGVNLNVWKTNKKLESVGGIRDAEGRITFVSLEGRLHFVAEERDEPAHVIVAHMEFRKPEKQ